MRALDRKLLRDLRRMWTQAAAIGLVVGSGVALFIATLTTYTSLRASEEHYYRERRFAHVWSTLARAPLSVMRDVAAIPGVAAGEGRIVAEGILDVPGMPEPASCLVVSIPPEGRHALNDLHVRRGRHAEARGGEVLVSEAFALAHGLEPGNALTVVVAGRRLALRIAGIALSPEHVMPLAPGAISPDDRRFAVLWLPRPELEALTDMRGAFNDVSLALAAGANEATVVRALDHLLEPHGGRGAYGRRSQRSHVMLEEHIEQLKALAVVVPSIFLLVAAFLVNVVLARLIAAQREQIGMLKAFGYSGARIAGHYLEFVVLIVLAGVAAGVPVGAFLGRGIATFYAGFFRFPALLYRVEPGVVALAALIALAAGVAGALGALRRVTALAPVVAMSPEVPSYRRSALERFAGRLAPALRMILRNLARRPLRAALTTAGMALAVAIVVLGGSSADGIDRMVDVQFQVEQREDLSITLAHARPLATLRSIEALPGVRSAEPFRMVQARVLARGSAQDVILLGLPRGGWLRRAVDMQYRQRQPGGGILVTPWLARRFGLADGDALALEVREGRRRVVIARLAGVVDEPLGQTAYMELAALDRLLGEPELYSGAHLRVDPRREDELYAVLKRTPMVRSVQMRRGALANFRAMSDQMLTFIRQIEIVFSIIIAFGVVYNAARIALAERGRELATLRVLGFTRAEISAILLGELGLLAVPAIPLGVAAGYGLSALLVVSISTERMHFPLVLTHPTYAFGILMFLVSALASALLVRRQLDRLELLGVLKARE